MTLRRDQQQLIRLSLLLLAAGALAAFWELFARQAPFTPLAIRMLPGPIAQLRETACWLGLLGLAASQTLPLVWAEGSPTRFMRLLGVGHAMLFSALLYAAFTGRMALQVWDPRPLAVGLTAVRLVGQALVLGAYLWWGRRLFRHAGPAPKS